VITQVLVLNGPNPGRLGLRAPEVYGSASFEPDPGDTAP
jgi:3-dehydroquinate dehydratase